MVRRLSDKDCNFRFLNVISFGENLSFSLVVFTVTPVFEFNLYFPYILQKEHSHRLSLSTQIYLCPKAHRNSQKVYLKTFDSVQVVHTCGLISPWGVRPTAFLHHVSQTIRVEGAKTSEASFVFKRTGRQSKGCWIKTRQVSAY